MLKKRRKRFYDKNRLRYKSIEGLVLGLYKDENKITISLGGKKATFPLHKAELIAYTLNRFVRELRAKKEYRTLNHFTTL